MFQKVFMTHDEVGGLCREDSSQASHACVKCEKIIFYSSMSVSKTVGK